MNGIDRRSGDTWPVLLKRLTLWAMLVLGAPLAFAAPTDFYRALLVRGTSNFEYGNFVLAERELRIAAFGLLEDAAAYQTAQVYLALVQLRLGQKDDATKALNLLLQAEKVQPGYRALPLPASVRTAFEKEVPSMLTAEQRATFPDLLPIPTMASKAAPVDELKNLESMAKKNPESIPIRAALAEAKFNAGDHRSARKLAESVLEKEPGNATALSVLGRISAQAGRYDDAAKKLTAVSAARALGADETAGLFVASVETNDLVTAERLAPTLSASVITRPDVARAFKKMTGARPKVADVSSPENPQNAGPPPAPVRPKPPQKPVRQAEPVVVATPAPVRVPNESESAVDLLAEANRAWSSGNSSRAVSIYKRLAEQKEVDRSTLLSVAMGLAQAGAFAESISAYGRAGRLRTGEEIHLFYKAVNYYHAGDFRLAREYLRLALPKITMTAEVADYKVRIEATP